MGWLAMVTSCLIVLSSFAFGATPALAGAPGPATHLAFSIAPTSLATAGVALASFAVSIEDSSNVVVTGLADTITVTSNCSIASGASATATSGVATFSSLILTVGTSCILTAADGTSPDTGLTTAVSSALTLGPATAYQLKFTTEPPAAATIGVPMSTFAVSIEDQYGNVVTSGTGATDTISLSSVTYCAFTPTSSSVAAAGTATFTGLAFVQANTCQFLATDTSRTLLTASSIPVVVATTAPYELGFVVYPPSLATAGVPMTTFSVAVEQSNGIVVTTLPGVNDIVKITSTCSLAGVTSVAAVSGVATFVGVISTTASICYFTATDLTRTLITAVSLGTYVVAGAPTHVGFAVLPGQTGNSVGSPIPSFQVGVYDVYNNVVTSGVGAADVITLSSICSLGGVVSAPAVAGLATFSGLVVNTPGTCALVAADNSRVLTTASANVIVGQPQATLVVSSMSGFVGLPLTLSTSGGSGTGVVSFTVANGTSSTCSLVGLVLTSSTLGTCVVTATKAASGTYLAASSVATTVTFSPQPLKALKVGSAIYVGRANASTILGTGFTGQPRIIFNVAGVSAKVLRDSGTVLTVVITVNRGVTPGVHVLTIVLANGKRTSVRFNVAR